MTDDTTSRKAVIQNKAASDVRRKRRCRVNAIITTTGPASSAVKAIYAITLSKWVILLYGVIFYGVLL